MRALLERMKRHAMLESAEIGHKLSQQTYARQEPKLRETLVKIWLQISKAEQLSRFKARQHTPFKRFKITPDDWRNRKQWNAYEQAVCDMVDRTSTEIAPWTLVEAEDKYFARIKVLQTISARLKQALER
jgi:polyphosphate kinase 2 (PPK2 family)